MAEEPAAVKNSDSMKEGREWGSYCLFGAKTIAGLLKKLLRHAEGVRGFGTEVEDVEHVHQTRVSARRLRVALPLFRECLCPTEKNTAEFERWMRALRRLARSLGEARDTDVQITSIIREIEAAPPQGAAGLRRLLLRLKQKRAALQKKAVATLERFAASSTEGEIMSRIRLIVGQAYIEGFDAKDQEMGPEERKRILAAAQERIAHVVSFGVPLPGIRDTFELHEMRKSAKRLRYTLEIFAPLYKGKLKNHVDRIKSLQDTLGTLNDSDVWLARLPIFMEEERERTLVYRGHTKGLGGILRGLEGFADAKLSIRDEVYTSFTGLWEKFCNERYWDEILKELEA